MGMSRAIRLLAAAVLVTGTVLIAAPANSQVPSANYSFRFDGTATVGPGIYFPALDGTGNSAWRWDFTSNGCDGVGQNGAPVGGTGNCSVSGGGPLLGDLLPQPACGNSKGFSDRPAVFRDPTGREWVGELHWDGVLEGTPARPDAAYPDGSVRPGDASYSLGSQLFLMGTVTSGAQSAQLILLLNASGGSNCAPQLSAGGATSFTINGAGALRTL